MVKRILAGIFLLVFLSLTVWLVYAAFKPERLPIGSMMPALDYRSPNGEFKLVPDSCHNIMIVHFHSNCKYCKYQLRLFNDNLEKFSDVRILFVTIEDDFFEKNQTHLWPGLNDAENVMWGEVDKSKFENSFGNLAVPSIFIFDKSGILISKLRGEVKLEKILKELKKSDGPEHRVGGYN